MKARQAWIILCLAWAGAMSAKASGGDPVSTALRCGWFDNPSPGNATLKDRDGEWQLAQQGGHQASGRWPVFAPTQWVRTGSGSAGYGCACMRLRADTESGDVLAILSARARPLASCRQDRALQGKEPANPLK